MQRLSVKPIMAMLWVSAVSIAGIARNVDSFASWAVLASVAVIPPCVMMWQWKDPRHNTSEAIQEAIR